MDNLKTINKDKVKGKIFTAKEIAEYLVDTIDKYYCDEVFVDVVVFNLEQNDYWLLGNDILTKDDIIVSSSFYTEDDVYYTDGKIEEIIEYCGLFDFIVIDGEVYKIVD